MYAETEFLLALIKDDDWIGDAAEAVYREHADDLWTSRFTLVELLLVAYREGRDTELVVMNAAKPAEVRGDVDTVVTAATYIEEYGFTPIDVFHLVSPTAIPSSPVTACTRGSLRVSTGQRRMKRDAGGSLTDSRVGHIDIGTDAPQPLNAIRSNPQ